ncbi:Pentapeptide repeats containing protein [Halomicronema hongdechloris C2206]|uniref:Pentapeptide repeats containing protein n=2 Tax=Halomicronema hongdechloris TaxID=1209493 RepID=A0A1Z3HTK2_9CYAN|nr:Pentapeptide repeats containing protein [Halomicronema hongdechloris C2206]
MEVRQFLRQYANGKRSFVWADLRQANLTGVDLREVNLSRANLTEANLSRANLTGANLTRTNLTRTNLTRANLTDAVLRQANLTGALIDLEALEPQAYVGAILPDGTRFELPAIAESEAAEPAPASAEPVAAVSDAASHSQHSDTSQSGTSKAAGDPLLAPAQGTQWQQPPPTRRSILRKRSRSLPWPNLILFGLGYGGLGLFLYLHQAAWIGWPLVWITAFLWLVGEPYLWFMPVAAALAALVTTGLSVVAIAVAGLASLGLFGGLKMLGWPWSRALRDAIWVGGIGAVLVAIASLAFYGRDAYSGGGIILSPTLPLALLILLGSLCIGVGSMAQLQLQEASWVRSHMARLLSLDAGVGLLLGTLVGWLLAH